MCHESLHWSNLTKLHLFTTLVTIKLTKNNIAFGLLISDNWYFCENYSS